MAIFTSILFCISLFAFIYKAKWLKVKSIEPRYLVLFFVLKLFVAGFYYYFYTNASGLIDGDSYTFFLDAKIVVTYFADKPTDLIRFLFLGIQNGLEGTLNTIIRSDIPEGNSLLLRFNTLLCLIFGNNYYLYLVFYNFLAFIGLLFICKSFEKFMTINETKWMRLVLIVPGLLFWTSGISKEAIVIFLLGMLSYFYFKELLRVRDKFFIVLFFVLLMDIKIYVAMSLIPLFAFSFISLFFKQWSMFQRFALMFILLFTLSYFLNFILDNKPVQSICNKHDDFVRLTNGGAFFTDNTLRADTMRIDVDDMILHGDKTSIKDGSTVGIYFEGSLQRTKQVAHDTSRYKLIHVYWPANTVLDSTFMPASFIELVKRAPGSILKVLTQPYQIFSSRKSDFLPAIENVIFVLGILFALIFPKKMQSLKLELILLLLTIVLIQYYFIGLVTPIYGAIIRYKITATPFLIICLILAIDFNRVKSIFSK